MAGVETLAQPYSYAKVASTRNFRYICIKTRHIINLVSTGRKDSGCRTLCQVISDFICSEVESFIGFDVDLMDKSYVVDYDSR